LLPDFVNCHSPRVRVGLGTIARVVASGEEIYARKLRFAEALQRIERLYRPYHRSLGQVLETTRNRFGFFVLLDCHSMPSTTLPASRAGQRGRVDIVLGDCHGTSCDPIVAETAQRILADKGYAVVRNAPYAGGFTTTHYGKPQDGGHCLQIEIGRGLYMDERSYERKPFFARLAADMRDLAIALAGIDSTLLRPA
jgi:N-formylglutamate amidohydrolase